MKKRTRVTRRAHREMSALFNSSGLLIGLILVLIGVVGNRKALALCIQASERYSLFSR